MRKTMLHACFNLSDRAEQTASRSENTVQTGSPEPIAWLVAPLSYGSKSGGGRTGAGGRATLAARADFCGSGGVNCEVGGRDNQQKHQRSSRLRRGVPKSLRRTGKYQGLRSGKWPKLGRWQK